MEHAAVERDARWRALVRGITQDSAIAVAIVAALAAFRALLCAMFVNGVSFSEIVRALLVGARFDAIIAALVVAPSFALEIVRYITRIGFPAARVRAWTAIAFCAIAPVFYAADYAFFREFSDHFNVRLMIALDGAVESLPETIWKSHHPVRLLLIAMVAAALGIALVRRIVASTRAPRRLEALRGAAPRAIVILACLAMYAIAVRGVSVGESPVRIRNAFVTTDAVLNRTIPSPVATLVHAFEDRRKEREAPSGDAVLAAIRTLRGARGEAPDAIAPEPLDNALTHARGAERRPRHVFLIVMEGQHGFALLPEYRDTVIAPELAKLAAQGAFVPNFVSTGASTDTSLAAIVSGLLVPDLVLSHEERALAPFATSLAPAFRRLGYRTRFFYGGYLGWARLDLYLAGQGFDEVYGAPSMTEAEGNAWGVWDRGLYDFVLKQASDDAPSLNVILTTTNHSPYDLPRRLRPPLSDAARRLAGGDAATLTVFEHEAYADRELGRFVEAAERRYAQALFAITGDHTAHAARARFERHAPAAQVIVPMIFAGDALPDRLKGRIARAASHLDIAPTLYELCAPAGFAYRSFGANLFGDRARHAGIGSPWSVTDALLVNDDGHTAFSIESDRPVAQSEEVRRLLGYQRAIRTLSRAAVRGAQPSAPAFDTAEVR